MPVKTCYSDGLLAGRHVYAPGLGPNPGGLLGQVWVAVDHSTGPTRGNVYLLSSVNDTNEIADPLDVHFARSADGGLTWSAPVRINDEPPELGAWQWFGTMAVAPTGRIDVIFNDTRNFAPDLISELYYTFSTDAGQSWTHGIPVSPPFDPLVGFPNQDKIGDYYDMISDASGVDVAYAATFNGEEDVYHLRIEHYDCNSNGISDLADIVGGTGADCNHNSVIDACELATAVAATDVLESPLGIPDGDSNGVADNLLIDRHGTITDLNVDLIIDHGTNGDLQIELSHNGTIAVLIDRPGDPATGSNGFAGGGYAVVLDDEGPGGPIELATASGVVRSPPAYTPNEPLAVFDGMSPLGRWTLRVRDLESGGTGHLQSWSLHFDLSPNDCDSDGAPDNCEADCQPNGVPDDCDLLAGSSPDIDANGVPDECDPDCNTNGLPDGLDLANGTSADCNANAVPDECESLTGGDFDGDGSVDMDDYTTFVACFAGPEAPPDLLPAACAPLCVDAFDFDGDGDVDLIDFAGMQSVFSSS